MPNINGLKSIPLKRELRSKGNDEMTVASQFTVPKDIYTQIIKESMDKGITLNMMIKLITLARYGAITMAEPLPEDFAEPLQF